MLTKQKPKAADQNQREETGYTESVGKSFFCLLCLELSTGITKSVIRKARILNSRILGFSCSVKLRVLVIALCLLVPALPALPAEENKSGVSPQTISLPSGPGSIEGLGESFEPQLNTGTAAYSVNLSVAPGRTGHQPSLILSYNSGNGNSPYGLGWNLPVTFIQRQTDKGLPRYDDRDTFVYSNGEDLVPLADGTYGLRNAGTFLRFRRVGNGWEARDKSGMIYRLGMHPDEGTVRRSRICREGKDFHATYKWLLDELIDTNGNVIKYVYVGFDDSPGQLYISEIRYNFSGNRYNSVVFRYETRLDAIENFRAGFKIRTGRRVIGIRMLSLGQQVREYRLNYEWQEEDFIHPFTERPLPIKLSLLRKIVQFDRWGKNYLPPLRFEYTGLYTKDVDHPPTGNFPGPEDVDLNGNGVADGSGIQSITNAPAQLTFQDGNSAFIDLNGDGLPDILNTVSGRHYYFQNLGNGRFANGKTMANAPFVQLSSESSTLADMDGDGLTDLLHRAGFSKWIYYRNLGNGHWAPGLADDSPPHFDTGSPDTRLLDLNLDNKIDLVRSNPDGSWNYCLSQKGEDTDHPPYGNFPAAEDLDLNGNGILDAGAWDCIGSVKPPLWGGITFRNPEVRLADMNGDRLQDVVWIRQIQDQIRIGYWPGKGLADFSNYMAVGPDLTPGPIDSRDLKLIDVNGDGLSDLIHVRPGQVTVWFNLADAHWSDPQVFDQTVVYNPATTSLRYADLNGNGTTDLVWIQAVPATPDQRIQFLDFSGKTKANQLRVVDNGLGSRITIDYQSSTHYLVTAREADHPWKLHSPVPLQVISRVTTETGLDLDSTPGQDSYIVEYNYRDAWYDPYQKEFRGFAFVKKIERGDAGAPTRVTRNFYHTGAPDDVDNDGDGALDERGHENETEEQSLKGQILRQEITTGLGGADSIGYDGYPAPEVTIFQRVVNNWQINRIHDIEGGLQNIPTLGEEEISYSVITQTDRYLIEQKRGTPKQLRKTFGYDHWGNLLEEKNYGDVSLAGDELFTTNAYAENPERGIRDKLKHTVQTDGTGAKVAESFFYYDGGDYLGLPLGQVIRGNLTRKRAWQAGSHTIDVERKAFDAYGNVTGIRDGNDHLRTIRYDEQLHTFPVRETIHLEDDKAPLEITAHYDIGLGKVIRSTDTNGHHTWYDYDAFGRPVTVIQPGDSWNHPTRSFRYRLVDPHRGLAYVYDADGNLDLHYTSQQVSSVQTRTRETAGLSGTLDSWRFTDGLGRDLAVMEEDDAGFILNNAVRFNARGTTHYTFQPYRVSAPVYQAPTLLQPRTEKQYDAMGRERLIILPPDQTDQHHQVETRYTPLHKTVLDENGHPKDIFSDGLERIRSINEHNAGNTYTTSYQHDPLGNLLQVTDAHHNVKTMVYDGLGRKIRMHDPDNGETTYSYDHAGNLIYKKDNKGQEIAYTYDAANRKLSEDFLNDPQGKIEVTYRYDEADSDYATADNLKGQLVGINDPSGAVFFSYDDRGHPAWQVKRIRDGDRVDDYQTWWNYDAMGRLTSVIWPDGESVRYQYNKRGLLAAIPGIADAITYHETGQLLSIAYRNGVKTHYDYDPRNRLIELKSRSRGQQSYFQHLGYQFDGKGNINRISDQRTIDAAAPNHAGQRFGYDDLDRLTSATGVYGRIDYHYDAIGNMIWKQSPAAPSDLHVNDGLINLGSLSYGGASGSRNRTGKGDDPGPHAVTGTESGFSYDYDANGNMTHHAEGDGYEWDYNNRLLSAQKSTTLSRYVYDHAGQRVIKTVTDGAKEQKVYYVSKEYEIRDDTVYKYVFIGSNRAARIETPTASSQPAPDQQLFTLNQGWNFISFKVLPADPASAAVFQPILPAIEAVYAYDSDQKQYLTFTPGGDNSLTTLQPYQGYVVKVKYDTTLLVEGNRSIGPIAMNSGWNLKGLPITDIQPPTTALAAIQGQVTSIWSYDTATESWSRAFADPSLPAGLNSLKQFTPNRAYWIKLNSDTQATSSGELTGTITFYHPDHLGSTSLTTDSNGNVISETAYYPFGRPRFQQNTDDKGTFYQYTGKELDQTGLFYYEARYMDPVIGRFVSVDPLFVDIGIGEETAKRISRDSQETNIYSYTRNNPVLYIDPTGKFIIAFGGQGSAGYGKGVAGGLGGWMNVSFDVEKYIFKLETGIYSAAEQGAHIGKGASIGGEFGLIFSNNWEVLNGWYSNNGVSGGVPVSGGIDVPITIGDDPATGIIMNFGVGGSFERHSRIGYGKAIKLQSEELDLGPMRDYFVEGTKKITSSIEETLNRGIDYFQKFTE